MSAYEQLLCARHALHPVLRTARLPRETFSSAPHTDTLYGGRSKNRSLEESVWTKLVIL